MRMMLLFGALISSVFLVATRSATAQNAQAPPNVMRSRITGNATFLTMPGGSAIPIASPVAADAPAPLDLFTQYRVLFGIDDPVAQLKFDRMNRDMLGQTHTTFQQVHHGVPVFGGVLKTHQNARGEFIAANGHFFPVPGKLNTAPTLDRTGVGRIAVSAMKDGPVRPEVIELVVVDPAWYGDRPQGAHLAYFVRAADAPAGRFEGFFIDAHSGAVLDRWNLVDAARNREVHDAGGTGILPGPIARTELSGPTLDAEVDSAFDFAGDTYDFYFRAFGRDSLNDNGLKLVLTVNSTAPNCPNAFWNGTQAVFCSGLVIDDVVGHELTHGVIDFTARLIYQNQPGQLNESYADVVGELVDLFNGDVAFPGPPDGPPWQEHPNGSGIDLPNDLRTDGCIGGFSVDVHEPTHLAGTYIAGGATFGPPLTETGLTGRLVLADPSLACPADIILNNAAQIAGNIAVVDRGDCLLVDKTANAQNAGAIGVVIVNNQTGRPPNPVGTNSSIVIPTVGVTQFDGQAFEAALANGETVEITMRANSTAGGVRWLVGESSSIGSIRDMWKPTCRSHPDRANHPFQTCDPDDNGGVHSGSGVPNHAFALVTDGGNFNGYTIDAIGPIKSGAVWYRALATYLTIVSDFEDAYAALNQAALDLVGSFPLDPRTGFPSDSLFTSYDAEQVDLALRAVEMNTPGLCGALDQILDPAPPTFCPSRLTIYQDDFEHGIANWTVSNTGPPTPYNWVQRSALPMQMPGVAWFAEDRDIGNCQTVDESAVHSLLSPQIDLFENATTPTLTFTHFVATEPTYDGGNLKISVNDGPFDLVPPTAFTFNAYNSVLAVQNNSNPLSGQPAFTGIGGTWGTSVVDLSGFAGPNDRVQFRFDFGKDGCTGLDGWYLSDLAVFTCLPAGDGDFDGNGRVDLTDYAAFQRCMRTSTRGGGACAAGDLSGNGFVDISDHAFLVKALSGP